MANLSNINNILRTGSLGVGINRDPLGAFEISSATKPGVKMFNTSTNGKTYEAYSDTNGNYIIYDQDADDNRFVINTSGNATFSGEVSLKSRLNLQRLSGGATTLIQFKNENGVDRAHIDFGGTNEELSFFAGAGTVENMRIESNGNLLLKGTGVTSLLKFDSSAYGQILSTSNILYYDIDTQVFRNSAGTSEHMRIDSSGRTSIIGVFESPTSEGILNLKQSSGVGSLGMGFYDGGTNPHFWLQSRSYSNYSTTYNLALQPTGGNVGIGTTSPTQSKLVISGGATGTVGGGDAGITMINKFDNPDNSWSILPVITGVANTGFSIRDNTDSADRLVIDGSGNVVIGDTTGTSPNSADRFLKIGKSNLQDCSIILQDAVETWEIYQNDDLQFSFGTTPTTVMTMQRTTGNVGIGTTSPGGNLEIKTLAGGSGVNTLRLNTNFSGGNTVDINPFISGLNNGGMEIKLAGSQKLVMLPSGNVGIGAASPSSKLQVGDGTANVNLKVFGSATSGIQIHTASGNIASLEQYFANEGSLWLRLGSTTKVLVRANDDSYFNGGYVGIGTTNPGAELHVVGRVKTTRIVSSNIILGNIRSNIVGTSYLLLVDLNVTAGFSLAGKVNAASYTTWNVSDIYVRKNYNATTGYATITGISKSGSTLSVVDISHSSGRFIALKLTGDPEVDVMWAGYRLDALFQGSGEVTTLTSGVTENSVYASY